jgi:predicted small secreted protein
MKRFNFLLVAIVLVLTITTVGCTTMAGTQDDYYSQDARVYGNRIYVDDPYRGTIVLERDPRTRRYYEVSSYDPYYYGNRVYSRGYRNYGYNDYPTYRRNSGGYYNGNNSKNNRVTDKSSEEYKKNKEEARSKILGNRQ